jgi:hypothetical protein
MGVSPMALYRRIMRNSSTAGFEIVLEGIAASTW